MQPNYYNNDIILVKNWNARKLPIRQQVVIAKLSHNYIIKRIIGIPKDEIIISEGSIYINKHILSEPYLKNLPKTFGLEEVECLVPPDHVFLLGDYRNYAHGVDSRKSGPLHISNILAKPVLKLWSGNK
jgi:signal peptidase I